MILQLHTISISIEFEAAEVVDSSQKRDIFRERPQELTSDCQSKSAGWFPRGRVIERHTELEGHASRLFSCLIRSGLLFVSLGRVEDLRADGQASHPGCSWHYDHVDFLGPLARLSNWKTRSIAR